MLKGERFSGEGGVVKGERFSVVGDEESVEGGEIQC